MFYTYEFIPANVSSDSSRQSRTMADRLNRLPSTKVYERYGISRRTLSRWMADPYLGFPAPLTINNRHYFEECALEAWERQRIATSRNGHQQAA